MAHPQILIIKSSLITPSRLSSKLVILLRRHQFLRVDLALKRNACNPGLALRISVDIAWLLPERLVDLLDGSSDGRQDVRGRFDRLDGANGIAGCDGGGDFGQLNVDDVAEGLGSVGGDAEGAWGGRMEISRGLCIMQGERIARKRANLQVLPSAESSIHSWSSVYRFSFTVLSR